MCRQRAFGSADGDREGRLVSKAFLLYESPLRVSSAIRPVDPSAGKPNWKSEGLKTDLPLPPRVAEGSGMKDQERGPADSTSARGPADRDGADIATLDIATL